MIDINAFLQSLPIMGAGLLGIFVVTIVIIVGIYILKAVTSRTADPSAEGGDGAASGASDGKSADSGADAGSGAGAGTSASGSKESAMDLLKEREMKDFLETDDSIYISHDL
ncbi:hypothetical protein SAMN02910369_01691 [Lachnospiraceae bacterium NE2001]|nr:hypothetical protein SAMN02910369_01691 [Lachnospiraceae bacterium NE2001]